MHKLASFFTKPGIIFCTSVVALTLIVLSFLHFRMQVDTYISKDMQAQMEAIQTNSTLLIQNEMNYLKRLTASMAQIVSRTEFKTDTDISQALQDYATTSNIVRTLFITLDGQVYTNYGGYLGQHNSNKVIDGIPLTKIKTPIFSQPYYAEDLDEVVFGVVAPASMGNQKGVLVSSYNIEDFSKLLKAKLNENSAEIGIVNKNGQVVLGKDNRQFNLNIFDGLRSVPFTHSSAAAMQMDFSNQKSGFSIYETGGVSRYCTYAPIGLNDWYVMAIVKESSLLSKLSDLESYGFQLTVKLVLIMLILLSIIITNRRLEQKKIRTDLERTARMDGLTGIYNRKATEQAIDQMLKTVGEHLDKAALLVIDVDNFKNINDQGGHLLGDNVLKECADRLYSVFGNKGVVGRLGGDEFIVFLRDGGDVERIEEKIKALIHNSYVLTESGSKQRFSISVGIAHAGADATSFLALYQLADAALYRAKESGKGKLST